ncbi:MAG: DNA primase large subunit PriL [Methanolinea sp.]|nr:DNA primase large subunit PriL [Methanolinea sp.]
MLQASEPLEVFLNRSTGKIALMRATERLKRAVMHFSSSPESLAPEVPSDQLGVKMEITSYVLARVLVSCARDRALTDRLVRYEAQRAHVFLQSEEEEKRYFIAAKIGLPFEGLSLPVPRYVELTAGMHEERWRLVNREVLGGKVTIDALEFEELLREQIRVLLLSTLPLDIPESVCQVVSPAIAQVQEEFQKRVQTDLGEVEESSFPPCMQAIMGALSGGRNITHAGRFALTAFLHNIGMDSVEIIQLYSRAPDFDLTKTQYQVEHISGRGGKGTEYTAPSCAAMRTLGLCPGPDPLCEKVAHPLSYYRKKKREKREEKGSTEGPC